MVKVRLSDGSAAALTALPTKDTYKLWLLLATEAEPEEGMLQTDLYQAYRSSLRAADIVPGNMADFTKAVVQRDGVQEGVAEGTQDCAFKGIRLKQSLLECSECSSFPGKEICYEGAETLHQHKLRFHGERHVEGGNAVLRKKIEKMATDYCKRWEIQGMEQWLVRCTDAKDPSMKSGKEGKEHMVSIAQDTRPIANPSPFPYMHEFSLIRLFKMSIATRSKSKNEELFTRLGCKTMDQSLARVEKHFSVFYEMALYAKQADEEENARKRRAEAMAAEEEEDVKRVRTD